MIIKKERELAGRMLTIETGRLAKLANGAVTVRYGDTMILAVATCSGQPREGLDFFPLAVEFQAKRYAAGKIPGGFFKREGRPGQNEILAARLIDRPIRPLFPKGFRMETQIAIYVLSSDCENLADVLGGIGASAALSISDIPFAGPIASVRVGQIDGEYVLNPTLSQLEDSRMDIILSGSHDSIMMVEGESSEVSEKELLEALNFGHKGIREIIALQNEVFAELEIEKFEFTPPQHPAELVEKVEAFSLNSIREAIRIPEKKERGLKLSAIREEMMESFGEDFLEHAGVLKEIFQDIRKREVRAMVLKEKKRLDGRGLDDIREIDCDVSFLPRTHGSALFTRGQTQSLGVCTLGTKGDEQVIDALEGESKKSYLLHYNFPGFSVGEAKPFRGTSRREIGHGDLAERALKTILPADEHFPYTIRIVSEILESNGSSSMATVCSGSLCLMDAGVPTKCHVAGIAMGLIKEGNEVCVLTDILGAEDALGDMDFKIAGTREGITALQMDIKIGGLTFEVMEEALGRAKSARLRILDIMYKTIDKPKAELSPYAPRITTMMIPQDKIGAVIGPSGKMIRSIIEEHGVTIDIDDSGLVIIASSDSAAAAAARRTIEGLVAEPEPGKLYPATIKRIMEFGAFAEFMPGKEGLIHISELALERVNKVTDIVQEGDKVDIVLKEIDRQGRFNLSRKAALKRLAENEDNE